MEQAKRKIGGHGWMTVIIAVLLAFLFVVETPLAVYAESTGKGKYIKETIMITASSKTDAESKVAKINSDEKDAAEKIKKANESKPEDQKDPVPVPKTYYLFEKPIYAHDGFETYIAYTTTNNVKNSVKSIKSMYMKGGWSYEDYNDYLDQLIDEADYLAEDLYKAICEFATHLKAEKTNALYAKKVLGFLYEDDSEMSLPDFFVDLAERGNYDPKNYANVKSDMISFMMQANKDILATIECALMIACKDSYVGYDKNDTSFLTGMQRLGFLSGLSGYKNNPSYAYLDVYVQDLLISLPDLQKDIRYYMDSTLKLSEEAEEVAASVYDDVLSDAPEGTNQILEGEKEYLEDIKSEGSEEKQIVEEIEAFDTAFSKLPLEQQNSYNNGKMYYDALVSCKYTGYDGKYESLLDLFMLHEGTTEKISSQYSNDDFYPFLIKLSEGQRALLKVGLPQFLSTYLIPAEVMNTVLDNLVAELNESAETEEEKIKGDEQVSVYKDVDRSLYIKNNGVAMTSAAIEAAKSQPLEHIVADYSKEQNICAIVAGASGGVAAASILTIAGMARYLQLQAVKNVNYAMTHATTPLYNDLGTTMAFKGQSPFTLFGEQAQATFIDLGGGSAEVGFANGYNLAVQTSSNQARLSFTRSVGAVLRMGSFWGIAMTWITAISIAVMIISIIVEFIYPYIAKEKDEPYIDIPRVMCSYEEVFGQTKIEGVDPVQDYIYYYGVKNPLLNDTDNKRANTRDGKEQKDTNITQYMIGDVANWTLKGLSRQWVAVYASTDSKAGNPVLANSLTVLNSVEGFSNDAELIPVRKFHENAPYDFNNAYAVTVDQNLQPVYLGYKCDNNATTTGTAQTASVFASVTLWGGIAAGLVLGGGLGALVTYEIVRKRKMKTPVGQEI